MRDCSLCRLGVVLIPPAGGDIDTGHKEYDCFMRRYDISIKTSFPSFINRWKHGAFMNCQIMGVTKTAFHGAPKYPNMVNNHLYESVRLSTYRIV